jgi:hypothetical protein
MNERIKELIEQSTSIVESPKNAYGWGSSYAEFDKVKFAELIVQDLIDSMIKRYGDDDELPIQEIKLFVKEHFGVEE